MYIHLATHSAFSLQEGLPLPEELVHAAVAAEMPALGLTDHRLLSGSMEFYTACKASGVQPVLGLEIDWDSGPLLLYAMNFAGWSNLCRISSSLALQPDPSLACSTELLAACAGDLITVRGLQNDVSSASLEMLRDLFQGRLYIALGEPSQALQVSMLAHRLKLPTIVAQPVYYLSSNHSPLQKTLASIRVNQPLVRLSSTDVAPPDSFFKPASEVESCYSHFPAALAATRDLAERCKFDLPLRRSHMPTVSLPPGTTATDFLRSKAEEGARRLYGRIDPNIRARLDHELEVIARMGYEPIFLIVEEILEFARRTGVPFSSRGSAASSLVAHCLGITSPDPLRLNLYFERFLNPARATPPDIDTDLCSRRRDTVIQHVFDMYGAQRVAMVGTINRYRPRSALGDVAKAHGLSPEHVRRMVDQLPSAFWARKEESDEENDPPSPFADLKDAYPSPPFQQIFDESEAILKLPRHLSVHPGGVVVAPGALTDLVPVMRSGSKGITITQLDLDAIELLGLVKIDLLGIRGLTVLGDVAEFIDLNSPGIYTGPLAVLESVPVSDPETADRVESGGTIGCFQIESPGMRATLREIHARSEDDIMAALALYRPGPLTGGLKDAFVRRYKGEEPVQHIHPALSSLLEETLGVILYQEQVLRIAHELAGFTLEEADLLRRAMSHFDPGKRMQELRRKFTEQAQARKGVSLDIGERVWEMMAAFAGYGFPKAHAASYAQVGWRSAWCKTHFPGEFMAAVLANWGGYYSQRVYLGEARRLGLTIHPPHVNFSGHNFVYTRDVASSSLFMGLDQVRDLTRRTIDHIIHARPFFSLNDFLIRVDPRPQEAGNLVRIGALDGFGVIPELLNQVERGGWQPAQPSLFEFQQEPSGKGIKDWTLEQKTAAQQELLGVSLEAHPLELMAEKIRAAGAISTVEAAGRVGQRVTLAGVRQSGHRSKTTRGESMMFMTLEDLAGMMDVVLFPDAYRKARDIIHISVPLLITGVVEVDASRAEPLLRVERVARLS